MPSDSVKAIVLSWLNQSNGNLSDFERLIAEIAEETEGYQWGEIDTAKEFQPLSEEETIARESRSLGRLPDRQDGPKSTIGLSNGQIVWGAMFWLTMPT